MNAHLWLIPLLPLAGFLLNGILGSRLPKALVSAIALLFPLASLGIVLTVSGDLLLRYSVIQTGGIFGPPHPFPPVIESYGDWITAGPWQIGFSFVLDQLSMVMLLVVTGVGFLIHVYSVGYMEHEDGYWRFFAYLNLFLFFMLTLVLAGNALLMFVGWEGVGLASYLLIGFYFKKKSAADAGKKAFIVNRIGDFGFLIGMFLLLANFGTLTFSEIAQKLSLNPGWTGGVLTFIALSLMLGAAGKSAQIPLYIWLPDAMEGPTPVSALIHAATMVTAGVYMVSRTHFLFDRSPFALGVVAVIGAATAIFAATIGLVQHDIKRVLAYSTVSQLGYMFMACGVAAYSAGVFHLVTHAFFKALLFLSAGSVIHGMGGEQDLRKMGGLRKKMPVTFVVTTIGVLAIAGIPPFAGFFSKDAILLAAFAQGGTWGIGLWLVGAVTALLTSFYMFRLWYKTFFGELRSHDAHPHESPLVMTIPLMILAVLSICGGWIGIERFGNFLQPAVGLHELESAKALELPLMITAVVIALIGWAIAHLFYFARPLTAAGIAKAAPAPYKLVENKYFVDEIYAALIVKPLQGFSKVVLGVLVDSIILGGAAWLIAGIAQFAGSILQYWQNGNIRSYAAWITAGATALLIYLLVTGGFSPLDFALKVVGH